MVFKFRGIQMSKTSKLLTQVGSVAALCFMFVAFQNCGKTMQFSGGSLEKASVIEIPLDDDKSGDDITPPGDIVEDPVVEIPGESNGNGGTNGDGGSNGDDGSNDDDDDNNVVEDSGPTEFICIVAGQGDSHKLALVDDIVIAETSAARTICVTENGCLNIASQKFEVKEAKKVGYCKDKHDNEHHVHLSDNQLQSVIDNGN